MWALGAPGSRGVTGPTEPSYREGKGTLLASSAAGWL
ncbi:hypothetical protein J2S51_003070 [Streptomyces sp. DSM 41269]|nr:hypothetical protein [Streptomyces sp. DSM 41269]